MMLTRRRGRVQNAVDAAGRNAETIETDVQNWLILVDKIIEGEAKKVKDLGDKTRQKCFLRLCLDFRSHSQLSYAAEEDAKVVDLLLQQGQLERLSHPGKPPDIVVISADYFKAFKSGKLVFSETMEEMRVHGMGGVGKIILLKEVARQDQVDKLCDDIIISVVT